MMSDDKISIGLFGVGRIGLIHGVNVAAHPDARLCHIVDVDQDAASSMAAKTGASVSTADEVLADPDVDAVIIASPTDTHAALISAAARAGKAIFCEKPIDLDINRVRDCLSVVDACNATLAVGFNRRFDTSFAALKQDIDAGLIGDVETVTLTSRDPAPPPVEYIARSGGLFRDMMIHDFDMARWLLGEEPVEVYATASCLVDPAIAAAGDIDTAMVTLRTASGRLCHISNSRRAVYGYDQRIEVFGSEGMLRAENKTTTTVQRFTGKGTIAARAPDFFLERYAEAYHRELDDFLDALKTQRPPGASGEDGRQALVLADAAAESQRTGLPVKI
jgi:myo-inositol 2-dehydrogenase/D-chiro-inositol 1-dehydrogenase